MKIQDDSGQRTIIATEVKSTPLDNPVIPTYSARHCAKVRGGRISAEVFARKRLRAIPVDDTGGGGLRPASDKEIKAAVEGGRKVADNATKRGSRKGPSRDAKAVREEKGRSGFLGDGEQERQRQIKRRKSKKRVQAPSQKAQMKKRRNDK